MIGERRGHFSTTLRDIDEGQRYAYRLDGGPWRPDPRSLWQPDGVHVPSAVLFPSLFNWTDAAWKGIPRQDLVVYELHVGTFTPEGTFDAVIPRLPELRDLGVTAIEIMPVAQFPGARNWGYDGVQLFAPQNTYGGPHGLQRLVDACHALGLAVILDVVYNHFGPEGNYVHEFGPYGSERYRTPWGPAFNFDGKGSDAVRSFVLDNIRLWIEAYHFDGLRLDATHAMFDNRPKHILREVKEVALDAEARTGRRIHIIAEDLQNDVRVTSPFERGGHGHDAQWNEDYHHALHAFFTGEQRGKYIDYGRLDDFVKLLTKTFILDGVYSRHRDRGWGSSPGDLTPEHFIVGVQNHDHVGNRARGERLSALVEPAQLRLAACFALLSPHLPFLFMGEEYGERNPFAFFCSFMDAGLIENVRRGRQRDYELEGAILDPQDEATFEQSKLTWSWPEETYHAGLRRLYQDLLRMRREMPQLRDAQRSVRLLPGDIVEVQTGGVRIWFHFGTGEVDASIDRIAFSSEAERYGGKRRGDETILPFECILWK